jgi:hypothetical protein
MKNERVKKASKTKANALPLILVFIPVPYTVLGELYYVISLLALSSFLSAAGAFSRSIHSSSSAVCIYPERVSECYERAYIDLIKASSFTPRPER